MTYIFAMFPDNRIRSLRKSVGLTQQQLGEAVGLHQTQIGNIENGVRALTFEWARRIAGVLGVSLADLLADADNPWRLTDDERGLIERYRDAEPSQRAIIVRVAEPLSSYAVQPDRNAA